jgi:hypothetical protein
MEVTFHYNVTNGNTLTNKHTSTDDGQQMSKFGSLTNESLIDVSWSQLTSINSGMTV